MEAIKAIYDGTNFKPMQPIPVKEEYEVIITFVKPVKNDSENTCRTVSEKKDRSAAFGYLKGKIHVPDDFNEPLDDFGNYM